MTNKNESSQLPNSIDNIFIDDIFTSMADAQEIINVLTEALEGDEINIHLSSLGGDVATVDVICYFIRESKATVIVHLYGLIASAATFIPLSADKVVVHPTAKMLIHAIQPDVIALDKQTLELLNKYNHTILKNIYSGFLTELELVLIAESSVVLPNNVLSRRFKDLNLC